MDGPTKKSLGDNAQQHQIKQTRGMKTRGNQVKGAVKERKIAQVALIDDDREKLERDNLTLAFTEEVKSKVKELLKLIIACEKGQLRNLHARSHVNTIPQVNPLLMVLQGACDSCQGLSKIIERQVDR